MQEPTSVLSALTLPGPLRSFDFLGRQKLARGAPLRDLNSEYARIHRSHFKFKSLSCWAYNISIGCRHACRFCYVSTSQRSRKGAVEESNAPVSRILREFGVLDPEAEWGDYVVFRPWDEKKFLASLRTAEAASDLKPDGNRAVLLSSSCDPYQTISIPNDPQRQKVLNGLGRYLVRRALELILKHSTINVRILTRSPLAKQDFDLYKAFGDRLMFGMSLPTLNDQLARIYEPKAPSPSRRLATLQAASAAGLNVYVAMAPTYPECDEADLQRTLTAIADVKPMTIFHEPINIRGANVSRIAEHAESLGRQFDRTVFDNGTNWRRYAVAQLLTVQKEATRLGLKDRLHLWPDKALKAKGPFFAAREAEYARAKQLSETAFERISEWPSSAKEKQ